jgi:hypothetical protein
MGAGWSVHVRCASAPEAATITTATSPWRRPSVGTDSPEPSMAWRMPSAASTPDHLSLVGPRRPRQATLHVPELSVSAFPSVSTARAEARGCARDRRQHTTTGVDARRSAPRPGVVGQRVPVRVDGRAEARGCARDRRQPTTTGVDDPWWAPGRVRWTARSSAWHRRGARRHFSGEQCNVASSDLLDLHAGTR